MIFNSASCQQLTYNCYFKLICKIVNYEAPYDSVLRVCKTGSPGSDSAPSHRPLASLYRVLYRTGFEMAHFRICLLSIRLTAFVPARTLAHKTKSPVNATGLAIRTDFLLGATVFSIWDEDGLSGMESAYNPSAGAALFTHNHRHTFRGVEVPGLKIAFLRP